MKEYTVGGNDSDNLITGKKFAMTLMIKRAVNHIRDGRIDIKSDEAKKMWDSVVKMVKKYGSKNVIETDYEAVSNAWIGLIDSETISWDDEELNRVYNILVSMVQAADSKQSGTNQLSSNDIRFSL